MYIVQYKQIRIHKHCSNYFLFLSIASKDNIKSNRLFQNTLIFI